MGIFKRKSVPEKEVVKPVETDKKDKPVADPTVDKQHAKEDKKKNALFSDDGVIDTNHDDYKRKDDETQAEYNERVPAALQPVVDGQEYDYLGRKKD